MPTLATEARATEELQRNISMDFRSFKRDVEWGHPRPPQTATGKELSENFAEKGGCAAVLRTPQKAQRQQFRGDSEAAEWEKKGRLMHICIPYGKGKDSIHTFLVWGIPGAWTGGAKEEENEKLLKCVFDLAEGVGPVPRIILGDLNTPPECSATIVEATKAGRWFDTVKWSAAARGQVPGITFDGRDDHEPHRLDSIIASEEAFGAMIQSGRIYTGHGIPGHHPVFLDLNLACFQEEYWERQFPKPLPLKPRPGWGEEDEEKLRKTLKEESREEWEKAVE